MVCRQAAEAYQLLPLHLTIFKLNSEAFVYNTLLYIALTSEILLCSKTEDFFHLPTLYCVLVKLLLLMQLHFHLST